MSEHRPAAISRGVWATPRGVGRPESRSCPDVNYGRRRPMQGSSSRQGASRSVSSLHSLNPLVSGGDLDDQRHVVALDRPDVDDCHAGTRRVAPGCAAYLGLR